MSSDATRAADAAGTAAAVPQEEATAREFRRQWAQQRGGRVRRGWARFGVSGPLSAGWALGLVALAIIVFGLIPGSIRDRDDALRLEAQGQSVAADTVEVHVSHVSGRGGGYNTVDGVRVRLPGSQDPVELNAVGADPSASGEIYDPMKEGWQAPSAPTGYQSPLAIRIRHDAKGAVVTAMTQRDYEYVVGADEPLGETIVGVSCLLLAAMSLGLNRVRMRQRARRPGR